MAHPAPSGSNWSARLDRAQGRAQWIYYNGPQRRTAPAALRAATIMLRQFSANAPEYPWALFWAGWFYGCAAEKAREEPRSKINPAAMTNRALEVLQQAALLGDQEIRVRARICAASIHYQAGNYANAQGLIDLVYANDGDWLARNPVHDTAAQSWRQAADREASRMGAQRDQLAG